MGRQPVALTAAVNQIVQHSHCRYGVRRDIYPRYGSKGNVQGDPERCGEIIPVTCKTNMARHSEKSPWSFRITLLVIKEWWKAEYVADA